MAAQATMEYHRSYYHRAGQMLYTQKARGGQNGSSGAGKQRSVCQPIKLAPMAEVGVHNVGQAQDHPRPYARIASNR